MVSVENIIPNRVGGLMGVPGMRVLFKLMKESRILSVGFLVLIPVLVVLIATIIKKYGKNSRQLEDQNTDAEHLDNEIKDQNNDAERQSIEDRNLNNRVEYLNSELQFITIRNRNQLIELDDKKEAFNDIYGLLLDSLNTKVIGFEYDKEIMETRVIEKELELFLLEEEIKVDKLNRENRQEIGKDIIESLNKQIKIRDRYSYKMESAISVIDKSIRQLLSCDDMFEEDIIPALNSLLRKRVRKWPEEYKRKYKNNPEPKISALIKRLENRNNEKTSEVAESKNDREVKLKRQEEIRLDKYIESLSKNIDKKQEELKMLIVNIARLKKSRNMNNLDINKE